MPIYDYRCSACGHLVEVIHAIDSPGPDTCAVCGGSMRKALSTPAIHFKGSGWAKKDAQAAARTPSTGKGGDKEAKPAAAADKGEPKPSEGSGTKASDSSAGSKTKDGAAVSSGTVGSSD